MLLIGENQSLWDIPLEHFVKMLLIIGNLYYYSYL